MARSRIAVDVRRGGRTRSRPPSRSCWRGCRGEVVEHEAGAAAGRLVVVARRCRRGRRSRARSAACRSAGCTSGSGRTARSATASGRSRRRPRCGGRGRCRSRSQARNRSPRCASAQAKKRSASGSPVPSSTICTSQPQDAVERVRQHVDALLRASAARPRRRAARRGAPAGRPPSAAPPCTPPCRARSLGVEVRRQMCGSVAGFHSSTSMPFRMPTQIAAARARARRRGRSRRRRSGSRARRSGSPSTAACCGRARALVRFSAPKCSNSPGL